ncbi:DUF2938 family protein [Bradyrhizobium sp. 200]|uniref:DUF2938 family protein n=1 Tax=Bradyrhizobium sp. 200 TaxID=2782665 RepID=UPI001FFF8604|nr:DUF2938 family protein [Bradyrhizobium sp. 200]UPJ50511.1 DUF2938 family protein [Bradyrhizobium sp. 200]
MSSYASMAIESTVVGSIATLVADLWYRLLQAVVGIPRANWGLVRRWVAGFPRGVVHRPITATPPVRGELAIGWTFHYAVGIAYAALYLVILRSSLGSEPTLLSAVAFGLIVLVAPWFVMQPALGLGFMAAHTPPTAVRSLNISVHAWFGVGLYLGATAWPMGMR